MRMRAQKKMTLYARLRLCIASLAPNILSNIYRRQAHTACMCPSIYSGNANKLNSQRKYVSSIWWADFFLSLSFHSSTSFGVRFILFIVGICKAAGEHIRFVWCCVPSWLLNCNAYGLAHIIKLCRSSNLFYRCVCTLCSLAVSFTGPSIPSSLNRVT